jgi:hypothetical protein
MTEQPSSPRTELELITVVELWMFGGDVPRLADTPSPIPPRPPIRRRLKTGPALQRWRVLERRLFRLDH